MEKPSNSALSRAIASSQRDGTTMAGRARA